MVLLLLLCISKHVMAQSSLRVLDEYNKPLQAASIAVYNIDMVTGFPQFHITNQDGVAELSITQKSVVIITCVGYNTARTEVSPGENKSIHLYRSINALNQVVVTGQFDITKLNSTVETVKVIDEKLLKQTSANTLRDIIPFMPNIRITEDNVLGSNTTVNGLGGQNIKLLIDGIPVAGRENGNIDFGQMQLNNIERIEITEGPMSVLYSSDASAGVINLISKKSGSDDFTFTGNIMTETPRSLYADVWLGKNIGSSHIALSGGRNYFDGFPKFTNNRSQQWNPYIKYFGTLNYGISLKNYSNEFRFSYFNQNTLNRGIPVLTPYDAYAFDQHFYIQRFNTSLHQDFIIGEGKRINWQSSYNSYSRIRETYRTDLTTLEQINLNGEGNRDSSLVQQYFSRILFINNGNRRVRWQAGTEFNYEFAYGNRFRSDNEFIYEVALLSQAEYKPFEGLQIKPGVRFNYNSRYKAPFIPALNVKYQLTDNATFRLALSRGYRTPSLKELSLLFVDANHNIYGNEKLMAEDSRYANIRGDFNKKYYNIDITLSPSLYITHIKNQIILAITDTAAQMYQYVNLESVNSRGGNMGITFTADQLSVSFNYGVNQLQSRVRSVLQNIWTPEFTAQMRWTMPKPVINLTILMKNVGSAPVYYTASNSISERTVTDGYTLVDAMLNKNIFKEKLKLSFGVKNMLNVTNLNASTGGVHNSGAGIAVARGRYLMSSMQWQLSSNKKKS